MTTLPSCLDASWADDLIAQLTRSWKTHPHTSLKPTNLSSRLAYKETSPTPPNTAVSTSPRRLLSSLRQTPTPTCTINHAARRPQDEECPICTENLSDTPSEKLVWCKGSCGRNVHKRCFEMWKLYSGRVVRCVNWLVKGLNVTE
jgi:hypothetical protein